MSNDFWRRHTERQFQHHMWMKTHCWQSSFLSMEELSDLKRGNYYPSPATIARQCEKLRSKRDYPAPDELIDYTPTQDSQLLPTPVLHVGGHPVEAADSQYHGPS